MPKLKAWLHRYWQTFSFTGLVFATLFFAASVTPSLLPRVNIVQGFLSGFSLAIGYGLGVAMVWLWGFLELPQPTEGLERWSKRITSVAAGGILAFFVWKCADWQNSIRVLMEMPPLESEFPLGFFAIAVIIATIIVAVVRTMIHGVNHLSMRLNRFVPKRVSIAISTTAILAFAFIVSNDLVVRQLLRSADRVFLNADQRVDSGIEPPLDRSACGSPESLISWPSIGRRGKNFIVGGPSRRDISDFTGSDAKQPIRVYAGMEADDNDAVERARLAVEELKRVGGFERKVLIVATPTGTGWLDEGAVDTIEYLHNGDTAIVSTQYSYLPSWLTILIDPERSKRSAQLLFDRVYGYWTSLPKDDRPKLYLFGLSLGSLGCEQAADLLHTFQDPIQGAVWSGPPFPSRQWSSVVQGRTSDSTIWAPRFNDQSMIRFTSQDNLLNSDKPWGPIRCVYIQHASDPMVWFSPDLAWRRPQWLNDPRGPDVSPKLGWYPVVTFLQIGFDLPLATSVPVGYGHNYSPSSYIDAWVAVTQPIGWNDRSLNRLKTKFYAPSQN
ncbi:hypothetical protein Poly51_13530 [Rubripirellula tenax]|uniref:Alpha/beta-hydrolase family protein n=1 Tax=Rubripirellula tenax TaxID=2528015 RepID=A0A5C6FEG1_9BACT|nr:alpha/beta-hydrolase family protein [Rubripirellula tenax]TWU58574.1 hypothetical protein Poly51_13530 [Rubripirellula tenax]